MIRTKKVLSALLVVAILVSTLVVTSLSAKGAETILAYKFKESCWRENAFTNSKPTILYTDKNGLRVQSDHIQRQYQMLFEVDETNADNLAEAINKANDYYNGNLYSSITVNSATNIKGTNCSPEIKIAFLKDTGTGNDSILVSKSQQITSGATVQKFKLDVSDFDNEDKYPNGYQNQIKYIYVLIQCYDWSCSILENGERVCGTQPDVFFTNIVVDDGQEASTVPVSTKKVDPNQLTFNNFAPKSALDVNLKPDTVKYSSDCASWKSAGKTTEADYGFIRFTQPNSVEQVQVNYEITAPDVTRQAIANANAEGGTHKIKLDITLASCLDPDDEPTIAEVQINLTGQIGNGDKKPETQKAFCWQYPGTTRTYYLDVSEFKNETQVASIGANIQNYWYYNAQHQLVDWDKISNKAGEQAAMDAGYSKCRIHGLDVIMSPVTVEKTNANATNTPKDFALNGFNKEGKVPENPAAGDPNVEGGGGSTDNTTTPSGITPTTTSSNTATLNAPVIKKVALSAKKAVKVTYKASSGADSYIIFRSTKAKSGYKVIKKGYKKLSYTDKTVKEGNTYYYKVKAVKGSVASKDSAYKSVKLIKYSAKPTLKLTAAKKALTVKISKKVKNAVSYQVYYSLNKKFKSKKAVTVKTSKKLTKLKKGKKYFVKARAVTKIAGKKYYSKWSKVVSKKTK